MSVPWKSVLSHVPEGIAGLRICGDAPRLVRAVRSLHRRKGFPSDVPLFTKCPVGIPHVGKVNCSRRNETPVSRNGRSKIKCCARTAAESWLDFFLRMRYTTPHMCRFRKAAPHRSADTAGKAAVRRIYAMRSEAIFSKERSQWQRQQPVITAMRAFPS